MYCPKCNFGQPDKNRKCVKCGFLFETGEAVPGAEEAASPSTAAAPAVEERPSFLDYFRAIFFHVEEDGVNPIILGGRVLTFLLLAIWGAKFIFTPMETNYVGESFMHLINLPFHEGGHIIFGLFGRFIQVLGGTLMQLLIPLLVTGSLLLKQRDPFGASVGLWWFAENLMDIAPYINDARALSLPLLGGVTGADVADYHDWEYLLGVTHLLKYDHLLARASYDLGIGLMLAVFAWGGYVLYRQFRNLDLGD